MSDDWRENAIAKLQEVVALLQVEEPRPEPKFLVGYCFLGTDGQARRIEEARLWPRNKEATEWDYGTVIISGQDEGVRGSWLESTIVSSSQPIPPRPEQPTGGYELAGERYELAGEVRPPNHTDVFVEWQGLRAARYEGSLYNHPAYGYYRWILRKVRPAYRKGELVTCRTGGCEPALAEFLGTTESGNINVRRVGERQPEVWGPRTIGTARGSDFTADKLMQLLQAEIDRHVGEKPCP